MKRKVRRKAFKGGVVTWTSFGQDEHGQWFWLGPSDKHPKHALRRRGQGRHRRRPDGLQ